ncbi:MAG: Amuc_1098 family type IV pilus outer membrane protein [Verrucomicrobiota bacterium]
MTDQPIRTRILLSALVFTLPLATWAGPQGGASSGSLIERQIARKNQLMIEAQEHIATGRGLEAEGDLEGAVAEYRQAIQKTSPEAPFSKPVRDDAVYLFCRAGTKLADERARRGNFSGAEALLNEILADDVDPNCRGAQKVLRRLDDAEWYNPAMNEEHISNVDTVQGHLEKAWGARQLGKFDESEREYDNALRVDPYNRAAQRGIEEIEVLRSEYYDSARDRTRATMIRQVNELWETPAAPVSISGGIGQGIGGSEEGRELILRKLNETTLNVDFEEATLEEAVDFLRRKSAEEDPIEPGKGIGIVIQNTLGQDGSVAGGNPITLKLENVPLLQVLRYVTEISDMKYKVEPFAVVIVPQWDTGTDLFMREFRVPPTFLDEAGGDDGGGAAADDPFGGGGGEAEASAPRRQTARDVLQSRGVTFADGASAFYNPSNSTLIVRNTQSQMELIEAIVEASQTSAPKQILITTKFVEVTQQNTDEVGFDWLLGGFNLPGNQRVFGSGGTAGNGRPGGIVATDFPFILPTASGGTPVPIGQAPLTSGLRSGSNAIQSDAVDGLLNTIATPSSLAPGIFGIAGVFTDPQFQVVVRALAQKKGTDLMSAPSIVTRSGQRAKIEVIREFIYPTEYDPPEIPQEFGSITTTGFAPGTAANVSSFPVTPANPTAFEMRPVGVTMEVDPVVDADNFTIELNIAPEVVEFEGFVNYGSPIQTGATDALGFPTTVVLTENEILQPVFSTRKLSTAVTIWDGQTVAIGGLIREDVQMTKDKVPFLGDVPLAGRLFRSRAESTFKRNLMVFVKATLIDPSGRRIHSPASGGGSSPENSTLFPDGGAS